MSILSRRNLLQRLGLLLGTAATALIPGSAFVEAMGSTPSKTSNVPETLELFGTGWHLHSADRVRGELPRNGDRLSMHGILLDAVDGQETGQFYSACFCPETPGRSGSFAGISLEMHTFTLAEGTIMGIGLGGPLSSKANRFAIVGGTGRFTGIRGDYTAMQDPFELAGSGRAEFKFSFLGS